MVDGIKGPGGGIETARLAARGAATQISRTEAISRAAAAGKTPNPAADLAAWGPIVDVARVTQLKHEIASGTYKVDPEKLAAKMIATDLPARPVVTAK
jgi:flagellar biosynthesis anti-sigma factor FlgM